jgi:phosphoserine phosphatase
MTANDASTLLKSWNDTAATQAIVEFVDRATREGDAGYVAPSDRVAVFDIDGTLWCEKPMPIEPGFILRRLLDDYAAAADEFLSGRHPTLDRSLRECAYLPMIDLLRYIEANGFSTYIASGGDRDFMRPVTEEIYGIPAERVIGSSNALSYQEDEHGGTLVYLDQPDVFDDGPAKPIRIWSRIGRRPSVAGGNSNGDIPMLRYAGGRDRPALRLLVLHDDPEREYDYTTGAETSLERAAAEDWTVVSIKRDWATVFA